jgi:type I restriction enzyme S subunit
LVAATCLVEQDEPKLFLPDKLWKIIPDEKITCTEYLRYLLAHPRFREKLTKQATGTSGSMLNISQAKVRGINMPVPPIKLQKQFSDCVWRSYNIRNKLEAASQSTDTLFNSLMKLAFEGML